MKRGELADRLGVHYQSVARWELGTVTPSQQHVDKIADLLNTTPQWLMFGTGTDRDDDPGVDLKRPEGGAGESPEDVEAWLEEWEPRLAATRFLGGIAPPGEQKEVKTDILEVYRRAFQNMGLQTPDWWFTLRGMVETDVI